AAVARIVRLVCQRLPRSGGQPNATESSTPRKAPRGLDGPERLPLARRRQRASLMVPQFDAQLPGPGVVHAASSSTVFSPPRLPHGELGSRGGEKTRRPYIRIMAASTREEASLVEHRLRPQ